MAVTVIGGTLLRCIVRSWKSSLSYFPIKAVIVT